MGVEASVVIGLSAESGDGEAATGICLSKVLIITGIGFEVKAEDGCMKLSYDTLMLLMLMSWKSLFTKLTDTSSSN